MCLRHTPVNCRSRFISRHQNVDFGKSTYRHPQWCLICSQRVGKPSPYDFSRFPLCVLCVFSVCLRHTPVNCRSRFISRHQNVDFGKSTYRHPQWCLICSQRVGKPSPYDFSRFPLCVLCVFSVCLRHTPVNCRSRFISRHQNVDFGKSTYRHPQWCLICSQRVGKPSPYDFSRFPLCVLCVFSVCLRHTPVNCRSRFISRHQNVDFGKSTYRHPQWCLICSQRVGKPSPYDFSRFPLCLCDVILRLTD